MARPVSAWYSVMLAVNTIRIGVCGCCSHTTRLEFGESRNLLARLAVLLRASVNDRSRGGTSLETRMVSSYSQVSAEHGADAREWRAALFPTVDKFHDRLDEGRNTKFREEFGGIVDFPCHL